MVTASHVAGIVGANDATTGLKGVAPDVTFGAYRVFGCEGSTESDIMIAAMERALADGMQVLNMSIGSSFQWPQYPTAVAASRLVDRGMVVVASIGNSGTSGLYAAGAPGLGDKVIGTASFDNIAVYQDAFSLSPDGTKIGYTPASGAPAAPTSGTFADGAHRHHHDSQRRVLSAAGRQPHRHGHADPSRDLLVLHQGVQCTDAPEPRASCSITTRRAFITPTVAGSPADHDSCGRGDPVRRASDQRPHCGRTRLR